MQRRVQRAVVLLVAALTLGASPALALELELSNGTGSLHVEDNDPSDENPRLGVIELSSGSGPGDLAFANLRCAWTRSITPGHVIVAITGIDSSLATFRNLGGSPDEFHIDCVQPSLSPSLQSPGTRDWHIDGLADDPSPADIDITSIELNGLTFVQNWSIPPAGPCPEGGGAQPCSFDGTVVADYFDPGVLVAKSLAANLTLGLGPGDRVRLNPEARVTAIGLPMIRLPVLSLHGLIFVGACLVFTGLRAIRRTT